MLISVQFSFSWSTPPVTDRESAESGGQFDTIRINTSAMATAQRILFPLAWLLTVRCIKICKYGVLAFEVNTWSILILQIYTSSCIDQLTIQVFWHCTESNCMRQEYSVQWYMYWHDDGYISRVTYIQFLRFSVRPYAAMPSSSLAIQGAPVSPDAIVDAIRPVGLQLRHIM